MTLEPASDARAAAPAADDDAARAGEYSLRLAAIGHDGTSGSVHHTLDARLHRTRQATPSSASDSDHHVGRRSRACAATSADIGASTAKRCTRFSSSPADGARLSQSRVTVQVADSETSPALRQRGGTVRFQRTAGARGFAASLKLGVLPPGEYVARAVVKCPDNPTRSVTRSFRLAPVAAATDASPIAARVAGDDAPAPLPICGSSRPWRGSPSKTC